MTGNPAGFFNSVLGRGPDRGDGKDLYFHLRNEQAKKEKWLVYKGWIRDRNKCSRDKRQVDKDPFNTETTLGLLHLTRGSPDSWLNSSGTSKHLFLQKMLIQFKDFTGRSFRYISHKAIFTICAVRSDLE